MRTKTRYSLRNHKSFAACMVFLAILVNSCELTEDMINTDAGKLEGTWQCDEQSELYKSTAEIYTAYISLDADADNRIIIDNFYQLGDVGVRANIIGLAVYISTQTLEGGFTVSGSGTISSGYSRIEWSYTVDDGSGVDDHVTAVYTKQ